MHLLVVVSAFLRRQRPKAAQNLPGKKKNSIDMTPQSAHLPSRPLSWTITTRYTVPYSMVSPHAYTTKQEPTTVR